MPAQTRAKLPAWGQLSWTTVRYLVAALVYLGAPGWFGVNPWADLGFFRAGSALLVGHGNTAGLHVYAAYPILQIGPLAFVVSRLLDLLAPFHLKGAVNILGLVCLLLTLRLMEKAALHGRDEADRAAVETASLFGGVGLALAWANMVVGWGHIDDTLCLTAAAAAWCALRHDRRVTVGLLLGLAIAAKPTGMFVLPMCLLLPAGQRLRVTALAVGVGVLAFLPFVAAAPTATVAGLFHFRLSVQPGSLLSLVSPAGHTAPPWTRPAQLAAASVGGWACWRWGRPECLLVATAAARVLLDPGAWSYYTAGLVLGALAVEQCRASRSARAWSIVGIRPLLPWLLLCLDPLLVSHNPLARAVIVVGLCVSCAGARSARQRRSTTVDDPLHQRSPGSVSPEVAVS